ncbi:MAG: class I SAM-dependent methyltransferase [Nitrospirota bacterium]
MIDEKRLSEVLHNDAGIRLIEPHIYSLYQPGGENTNSYDTTFGTIYDLVACNRFYNRFVLGYKTSDYHSFCLDALESSSYGWVLDAGCGSLAFTAKTYAAYSERPIVCLDQSLKLLRLAKSRMMQLNGDVPANMIFLHGDALHLPFKTASFSTVISLNLLHVLEDVTKVLRELKKVVADRGTISLTTMIENDRLADTYLRMLGRAGELFPRSARQLFAAFDALGIPVTYSIKGNMTFISYRQ